MHVSTWINLSLFSERMTGFSEVKAGLGQLNPNLSGLFAQSCSTMLRQWDTNKTEFSTTVEFLRWSVMVDDNGRKWCYMYH